MMVELLKEKGYRDKNNFVEIIGPPGVGKSTLYMAACKSWSEDRNWVYEEALLFPPPSINQVGEWLEYYYKKFTGRSIRKNPSTNNAMRFSRQNPELSLFLWDYLGKYYFERSTIPFRYRAIHILFGNFSRYQEILNKNSCRPVLIQEGFLQKSFLIHEDAMFLSEILDEYLSLIPLPAAVISLEVDDQELLSRVLGREKIIASHQGKNRHELLKDLKNWQLLNSLIIEKLSKRNVLVRTMNAEDSVEKNVKVLNGILKQISINRLQPEIQ